MSALTNVCQCCPLYLTSRCRTKLVPAFTASSKSCLPLPDGFGWFENSQLADKYLLLQANKRDGRQFDRNLAKKQMRHSLLGRCCSSKMSGELHEGTLQQKSPARLSSSFTTPRKMQQACKG